MELWKASIRPGRNGHPQNQDGRAGEMPSGNHLLSAKRPADRPQDQADIVFLEELKRLGKLS